LDQGTLRVKPYSAQDRLCIDTIRTLAIDAVQAASSGHPGAPLSLAPAAYVLFARIMRHNLADPAWPDRDRFVLSAGHASMLLYASLHLSGYDLSLDEIRRFAGSGRSRPAIPSSGTRPASRRRPARSARASRTASAWRWPSASCASATARRSSTTASSPSAPTAT
jgi:hypothetical protein